MNNTITLKYNSHSVNKLELIKSELLTDLNNKEFADTLFNIINNTDGILESSQPQNGKTKVILTISWLIKYYLKKIPIIILDNSIADIEQLKSRLKSFNNEVKKIIKDNEYKLNYYEVKSQSQPLELTMHINQNSLLVLTLHERRYRKLTDILELAQDKNVCLIFDESDKSVGSIDPTTDIQKELIFRQLMSKYPNRIQNIYITATPFAVQNSPHRNLNRQITLCKIPNDMYEHKGLEYRDFFHPKNQHLLTDCIKNIKNIDTCSNEFQHEFIEILNDIKCNKVSSHQPNIALINISYENNPKFNLVTFINKYFSNEFTIAVYIGDGINHFYLDKDQQLKFYYYKNYHIGKYLQILKNSNHQLPIIILATNKATRSQTYKSDDHQWSLTHFLLELPEKAHVETIIQCLRGNGQYPFDSHGIRIYLSTMTYDMIIKSYINKELISNAIMTNVNSKPRNLITDTQLIKMKNKYSRNNIDDTKYNNNKIKCHAMYDKLDEAILYSHYLNDLNQLTIDIDLVTSYYEIPFSQVADVFTTIDLTREEPFINMSKSIQNSLRSRIISICLNNQWITTNNTTCQICYSKVRSFELNNIDFNKSPNYRADIIALDPSNTTVVPIVIYKTRDLDQNKGILWQTTTGKICYYVPDEIPFSLATLKRQSSYQSKCEQWLQSLELHLKVLIIRNYTIDLVHPDKFGCVKYILDGFNLEYNICYMFIDHSTPLTDEIEYQLNQLGYHLHQITESDFDNGSFGNYKY